MNFIESSAVPLARPEVPLLDQVAARLRRLFAGTARAYIHQQPDGSYRTIRRRLTTNVVRHMLITGGSVGAYQVSNGRVSWICFDFDITKQAQQDAGDAGWAGIFNDQLLPLVDQLLQHLRSLAIPHLVEFSGNRGVHVWVTFDRPIPRTTAHRVLSALVDGASLSHDLGAIHIDRFPPDAESISRYGKAVKLPLARHQKSQHFAYLMTVVDRAHLGIPILHSCLSDELLRSQAAILDQHSSISAAVLLASLNLPTEAPGPAETPADQFLRCRVTYRTDLPDLSQVISALRRCAVVDSLFARITESQLATEDDRVTVAGLLNRIEGPHGEHYGQELLLEYFATLPGYNVDITREKLSRLRLPPPTCAHLQRRHPGFQCQCAGTPVFPPSPILHLSSCDCSIKPLPVFALLPWEADNLKAAQVRYSLDNDEIPVHSTINALENLTSAELANWTRIDEAPPRSDVRFQQFKRSEGAGATRVLFALSAKDKIWTAAHTLCLNHLYHSEFSDRTFGYRLQPGCGGHNLFRPWFRQWQAFVAEIADYVDDHAYDDYIVVKLDIKGYYDSVDLHRLQAVLIDGATANLRRKLAALSADEASLHRAAVRHLINAARQLGSGDRGLPQGPAFARYLAEVFLLELDSLAAEFFDKGCVHYSRFVDDMVLIFEPEPMDAPVSAKARIDSYLRTLALDLNLAKGFLGKVSDFRAPFKVYRQEEKYTIDQASRRYRSAPRETIETAAKRLLDLVGIDGTTTPKIDELSFFYSHLTENTAIAALQQRLEGLLLTTSVGRGSVFARLFNKMIDRLITDDSKVLPNELSSLTGLGREALLNAILAAAVTRRLTEHSVEQLHPVLVAYTSTGNSSLERQLLLSIMMVDPRVAQACFLEEATREDSISAISASLPKKVPTAWNDRMLNYLADVEFSDHVRLAYELIFTSECGADLDVAICRLFINRNLSAIGSKIAEYRHDIFQRGPGSAETFELREMHHQLICFAPLVGGTAPWRWEQLTTLWTNAIESWRALDERPSWHALWLRRASKLTSLGSVNSLILGGIRQDMLGGRADHERIFRNYYELLVICVMRQRSQLPEDWQPQQIDDALKQAGDSSQFIKWILSNGADTILWPNTEECVENVVRNDLMILNRGPELMVRFPEAWPKVTFAHLPALRIESDGIGSDYICAFYNIARGDFDDLHTKILDPSEDLIEFARQALEVRSRVRTFSSEHFLHCERFVNVFGAETRLQRDTLAPQTPFSGLADFFVFNGTESAPNTAESFDANIWRWVADSGLGLLNREHAVEVISKDMETSLVPFKKVSTRLEALRDLVSRVPRGGVDPGRPEQMELVKCATLFSALGNPETAGLDGRPSLALRCDRFLEVYLSLRDRSRFEDRVLFDPQRKPRCATLRDLYISVAESIERFESQVSNTQSDFQISQELHGRLYAVEAAVRTLPSNLKTYPGLTAADFKKCTIAVDVDTGTLMVDGQDVRELGGEVWVARVSREEPLFACVTDFDFAELGNAEGRTFLGRASGLVLIALASRPVLAAWQAVEKRHQLWDKGTLSAELIATEDSSWMEIERSSFFARARQVVMANLGLNDSRGATKKLIRWLLLFDPPDRFLLLEVIAAHYCVKEQNVQYLLAKVDEIYRDGDVVFTIKEPADLGGIHRILARAPDLVRRLEVARPVPKIANLGKRSAQEGAKPRLIVLHDVGISGSQIARAFKSYYLADDFDGMDEDWAAENRYHLVAADSFKDFRTGLLRFDEVYFVFGLYTEEAEDKIRTALASHYQPESLKFDGSVVCDGSYKLGEAFRQLNATRREEFASLVCNEGLLKTIFDISPQEESDLARERKHAERINLMVRVESVPKGAAKLFTLRPRDAAVEPLFKRIAEHPPARGNREFRR
jgi:hypothetical protein